MIAYISKFWVAISNLHIKPRVNIFKQLKQQLINQYLFLILIIQLINCLRAQHYGLTWELYIDLLFTGGLAYILFSSGQKFNPRLGILVCALLAVLIFLFSSVTGGSSGVYMYNFALLTGSILLFNRRQISHIIGLYSLIIILSLINHFSNYQLFFNPRYQDPSLADTRLLMSYIQTILLLAINGWYLYHKSQLALKIYRRKIRQRGIISELERQKKSMDLPTEMDHLIEVAKNDDILLIPKFNSLFPEIQRKLRLLNPKLTAGEFKLCILLSLKFTTKDIAHCNHISVRTVQTRKNRLRKNFSLPSNLDLYQWIDSI